MRLQHGMGLGHHRILAGMGARRDPDRPVADDVAQIGELLIVCRGHGRIVFEIADDVDARRTEPGEALAVLAGLDEADRDPRQQRPGGVGMNLTGVGENGSARRNRLSPARIRALLEATS